MCEYSTPHVPNAMQHMYRISLQLVDRSSATSCKMQMNNVKVFESETVFDLHT